MDGTQIRKRPRPVVSCLRCRDKKLKCDRVTPCENCTKAGCSADCAYNQTPETVDSMPKAKRVQLGATVTAVDQSGRATGIGVIEDLQQRVAKLEELLSVRSQTVNFEPARETAVLDSGSPQSSNTVPQSENSPPYLGTLVVKGSRSRYHGQNNRITLLNQFAEAKEFINQCTKDSTLIGLAKEVQFLQSKSQLPLNSPESVSDVDGSPELLQLRALLPSKAVCDQLLETYTKNFEKTLRILHVPSFLRQYAEFWTDPDNESYRSSPLLAQLTAILVVSLVLEDKSFKSDNPSTWEYLKLTAVDLIRAWLQKLGRKQRTEFATLQVQVLILLARHLRLVTPEELWRESGTLVRSAMVMGLHLDLSKSTEFSVFQAENRRRLWITIVEMDLQASIASGMPLMAPELDFGSLTPANLNDSDFDESTATLPPSKPSHEYTDSLALITLAKSLQYRIRAMAFVKSAGPDKDLSELVKQGQRLEACLRQIPSALKLDHTLKGNDVPALLLNRVLVDVYTCRPLLCLYRPLAMGNSRDDPMFLEIQRVCLESSLAILSYQDYFDPNVADLDVFNSTTYWDVFQIFCKNDILWAALSVCGYIKLSTQQQSPSDHSQPGVFSNPQGMVHSKASLTRIVENSLDSLTRRIGENGSNIKDVLLLSVVLQSVRARGSAQLKERWMYQGAQKALSACRQHLLPAMAEQPYAFNLPDLAQMLQSTQPMLTPYQETQLTPSAQLQLPDFFAESSALATEFNNFQGDPFTFEDGSFAWNL